MFQEKLNSFSTSRELINFFTESIRALEQAEISMNKIFNYYSKDATQMSEMEKLCFVMDRIISQLAPSDFVLFVNIPNYGYINYRVYEIEDNTFKTVLSVDPINERLGFSEACYTLQDFLSDEQLLNELEEVYKYILKANYIATLID